MGYNNNGGLKLPIGFSVDKEGISRLLTVLNGLTEEAKKPGAELDASLQQAGQTAQKLVNILNKTYNTNLGTLNVTKFNQELSKSNLSLKQVKSDLVEAGADGVVAFNKLSQTLIGTNLQSI